MQKEREKDANRHRPREEAKSTGSNSNRMEELLEGKGCPFKKINEDLREIPSIVEEDWHEA